MPRLRRPLEPSSVFTKKHFIPMVGAILGRARGRGSRTTRRAKLAALSPPNLPCAQPMLRVTLWGGCAGEAQGRRAAQADGRPGPPLCGARPPARREGGRSLRLRGPTCARGPFYAGTFTRAHLRGQSYAPAPRAPLPLWAFLVRSRPEHVLPPQARASFAPPCRSRPPPPLLHFFSGAHARVLQSIHPP